MAYRANIAAACHRAALTAESAEGPAAALECFQQYLFAIEDLATWADTLSRWHEGEALTSAAETANANWAIFSGLQAATPATLVALFHLPDPADSSEPQRAEYQGKLQAWCMIAQDVGHFANRDAQNGGQLANRLHNKMKHGLHFVVGTGDGEIRAHFYPHKAAGAQPLELPSVRLSPDRAERRLRVTFDISRLTSAILRTSFVAHFHRDPVNGWQPPTEPAADLSVAEIEAALGALKVPRVKWVGGEQSAGAEFAQGS